MDNLALNLFELFLYVLDGNSGLCYNVSDKNHPEICFTIEGREEEVDFIVRNTTLSVSWHLIQLYVYAFSWHE